MKVKELIDKLNTYNQEADVEIIINHSPVTFKILYGGGDGCNKRNCDYVCLDTDDIEDRSHETI